jgi:hypothetical protein
MSDLLSRLIGRATWAPSRVEPVLPSLYESAGAPEVPAPVEQAAMREAELVDGRETPARPDRKAPAQAPALITAPVVSVPHASLERVAEQPERRKELSPRAEPPSVSPPPAASNSTSIDGIQPPWRRPATIPTEPQRRPTWPADRVEETDGRPTVLAAALPLPAVVKGTRNRSRPQSKPPAPAPKHARAEAAVPVEVQVTIGHIEVRTAPATASLPQRRISRPAMSLEDYLRRRNGGAR